MKKAAYFLYGLVFAVIFAVGFIAGLTVRLGGWVSNIVVILSSFILVGVLLIPQFQTKIKGKTK